MGPIGMADRECEQSGMRRHDEDIKKAADAAFLFTD
jgi:hypothetical protein